ncbi:MAG: hypothetical protein JWO06_3200 [Bacteroidota bacterium]|nr:hypothetical protein [Bacteroidota bacterium]
MKSAQQWLDEYSVSHQNPTNKFIHWICVPLIFFSVTGFLYSVELPIKLYGNLNLNLAILMLVLVIVYYSLLSRTLWIGMLLFSVLCVAACYAIAQTGVPVWAVSAIVFVLAWIGQFYGHNIEGKKPSFMKDIQYLMIGPAWLMSFVYKKIGIAL